jgi:ABC-type sugar transport system ATPase subunit
MSADSDGGDAFVRFEGIRKAFVGVTALDDVSLSIRAVSVTA